jgi:type VI protein secretion system component VasF
MLEANSGIIPLRLPLILEIPIETVLAILALLLVAASFLFFALLASIAHDTILPQLSAVHKPLYPPFEKPVR